MDDSMPPPLAYQVMDVVPPSGWRTAIGVISIIVGSLAILSSAAGLLQMVLMSGMTTAAMTGTATTTMTTTSTGVTTGTVTVGSTPNPFNIPWAAKIVSMTADVINVVLSGFLVFAGIAMLRRRRVARTLHLVWSACKIPLIVLATFGQYLYTNAMFQSMSNMPGMNMNFGASVALLSAIFGAVISLLYPVALLIVLNVGSIRRQIAESSTD